MKEKDLVKKISDYLKTENDLFFWKEHGGQFGTAGIPDIIVCYKGRFLAFECKVGKNKPTVLQEVTIPREFMGMTVPEILVSGDHKKIDEWRRNEAIKLTKERRPDLYEKFMEQESLKESLSKKKKRK